MKKIVIVGILLCCIIHFSFAKEINRSISSPSNKINLQLSIDNEVRYSVNAFEQQIVDKATIGLQYNSKDLTKEVRVRQIRNTDNISELHTINPLKYKEIKKQYHGVLISLSSGLQIEFRVYDDGVAYRYISTLRGDSVKVNEQNDITFHDNFTLWSSPLPKKDFTSSYEVPYDKKNIESFTSDQVTYLPILLEQTEGIKLLYTETDLDSYPHMFFEKGAENQLKALFPLYPQKVIYKDKLRYTTVVPDKECIAKTVSQRSYPWRIMIITENDEDLLASSLVRCLEPKSKIENTEWIKPGKVAWEWWNERNIYGVDFKSDFDTPTIKYYIDFASEYHIPYLLLDSGWSFSREDITKANKNLDLNKLITYGQSKGVKIWLWMGWQALQNHWDMMKEYARWGIAGIKVDYMNRADQNIPDFMEAVAKEAAQNHLMVDFHGCPKPVGLLSKYPNVMAQEGVLGLEQSRWSKKCTPTHDLQIPFIRMINGAMDYTPGAMRNFHEREFTPNFHRPSSMGTRSHQLAQYVIYESGIAMLCDSPSNYKREPEYTHFLTSIPNTWDDTKILEARVEQYILLAKQKNNHWYVAGINGKESREVSIDLSFLSSGTHKATIVKDGINADRFAEDYKIEQITVNNTTPISIKMEKGGGFVIAID